MCSMWIMCLFATQGLPYNTCEDQGLAKSFQHQQRSESTNQAKTLQYSISHPSNPIIPD